MPVSTVPIAPALVASPTPKRSKLESTLTEQAWIDAGVIHEYASAANPTLPPVPVKVLHASLHTSGETRIIPFDLSTDLATDYPATSPNLLAAFVRICATESIETIATATSQAFFVIRGAGSTHCHEHGTIRWSKGDLFVVPKCDNGGSVTHTADEEGGGEGDGSAALYWITDAPLLSYLGVAPCGAPRFSPTLFKWNTMVSHVERIRSGADAKHLNRLGILLQSKECSETKTLSHTLWSLLNLLPSGEVQRPHKHNSVALDLAVSAAPHGVYTIMGPEINDKGEIVDPLRVDWVSGAAFVTPPGWWHSHVNESQEDAWVLPLQDAGLYTYQRTLDIRFVDEELALEKEHKRRGATFKGSHVDLKAMVDEKKKGKK